MTVLHVSLHYENSFENTYYKYRNDKQSTTISDINQRLLSEITLTNYQLNIYGLKTRSYSLVGLAYYVYLNVSAPRHTD